MLTNGAITWRRLSGRRWESDPPEEDQAEHREEGVLKLGFALLEALVLVFFS